MMTGTILEQGKLIKKSRKSRMKCRDKRILTEFAALVRQQFPEARIWAFGSRVKGTATQEEVVISTVTYSTEQFERGPCSQSAFRKLKAV